MPFITINGVQVQIVENGETNYDEIGGKMRSFDGTLLRDRRAIKRKWRFSTPPLAPEDALGLIGLVQGTGHMWRFDGTTTAIEDASDVNTASSGGLVNVARTGGTIVRGPSAAVNGLDVANVYTAPASTNLAALRGGALGMYDGSVNELPANQRVGDNTTGTAFTAINSATLNNETIEVLLGTNSVEVVTTGVNDGISTSGSITAAIGETFTGSIYLLGAIGGESVTVRVREVGGSFTAKTVTLSATEWRRVWVSHTNTANGNMVLEILSASGSPTFYCDCFQLEEQNFPAAWVDGTRGANERLVFDSSYLADADSFTFACWQNGSAPTIGNRRIFQLDDGTEQNRYILFWQDTNSFLNCTVTQDNTQIIALVHSTACTYGLWEHLAVVFTLNDKIKIYRNGALVATSVSDATLPLDTLNRLALLSNFPTPSVPEINGEMDDAFMVPYALSADQIEDIYNSGTLANANIPNLICAGDFTGDNEVICKGTVTNTTYRQVHQPNGWRANSRVVNFTLEEV